MCVISVFFPLGAIGWSVVRDCVMLLVILACLFLLFFVKKSYETAHEILVFIAMENSQC